MMLQALIAYADREKLGDPDFKKMSVRWEIALDGAGGFIVIPRLKDPDAKKKQPRQVVRPFTRNDDIGHGKAHFLCDTPERALGMMPESVTASATANRAAQFAYFKDLLRRAAEACPQSKSPLEAVLTALETTDTLKAMQEALKEAKAKNTEPVTFSVANMSLLDIPELKTFWQSFRRETSGASAGKDRGHKRPTANALRMCLATGQLTQPVKTAAKIRGVPNTQGGSANLIAFDKDAFTSYGLKKAFNAAISPGADVKICGALEDLIEKGTLIPKRVKNVNKSKQVVYVHWTREPDEDPFDLLETADEAVVAELLRSPLKGIPPSELVSNKYYLLSLSGNISRIIVRDWLESSVSEVKANVRDWFDHLTIMRERDGGFRSNHKIVALLYGLVRESLEELPSHIHTQLLSTALRGAQLPQSILAAALRRQQIEPDSNESDPTERAKRKATINARIALIKLYIVRNHSTDPMEQKVMSDKLKQLDSTSTDIAYLCGQLFAVIGRLQLLALGKVGTSLAERTYGGVSTRPASTLGPILTKVPAYLKKANSRIPGAGTNKQKEIETLCARIDAVDKAANRLGFPPFLGLEEQGRFALGYYCQLAQYRADRNEAAIEKEAEELPVDNE
jgi:CRISPR-associated protein Csd1